MSYVINTIVNCTLKAGLPDSAHHVTGILCTAEKWPILLYIMPSIYIARNALANYGSKPADCHDGSVSRLKGFLLGLKTDDVF